MVPSSRDPSQDVTYFQHLKVNRRIEAWKKSFLRRKIKIEKKKKKA